MLNGFYKGKKVWVSGHTGFKGSWLTFWLTELGASVKGYSVDVPTEPSLFEILHLSKTIEHQAGDVRNRDDLKKSIVDFQPDMVFHLAAQPIVMDSFEDPLKTFETNFNGTLNLLEILREIQSEGNPIRCGVMVTSDKCYENTGKATPYVESDSLGGSDPYSASKGCMEILCHSYFRSFFSKNESTALATARAGNVIGGGDWAPFRIIPDAFRAWEKNTTLQVRNPHHTRPWQHVLEPVGGYLLLGERLYSQPEKIRGQAFNFGPKIKTPQSVADLLSQATSFWPKSKWEHLPSSDEKKESALLHLDCKKAENLLNWHSALSFEDSVKLTMEWYLAHHGGKSEMTKISRKQLDEYRRLSAAQGSAWIK